MKNNKMHKIDIIFLVGIAFIAILGALTDYFYWKGIEDGGFPVFSCMSIVASYVLWIILLVYSSFRYKEKQDKPQYVRWYMYFLLPFLHIAILVIVLIIGSFIINIFKIY